MAESACEIGSHGQSHLYYDSTDPHTVLSRLGRFQQGLDDVLGFHYQVRWFRPPFGKIGNNVRALRMFGYEHSLLWDVSFSPGFTAKDITRNVKNGSIILFHARHRDYECLEEVIPWLLEAGFEPVTVSALFGFDPPETSDELYMFNKKDYQ